MWFFGSKKKYKEVVALRPPLVGTFQQHIKMLKKLLPDLSKEEIEIAKERWTKNDTVVFLSPLSSRDVAKIVSYLDQKQWLISHQGSAENARCGCDHFYAGTCCTGIPLGIVHEEVDTLTLPETLFTRGSLLKEMSLNQLVELTEEEILFLQGQGAMVVKAASPLKQYIARGFF